MTSAPLVGDTLDVLARENLRNHLIAELESLKGGGVFSREQVGVVLGQWFHPLHYFPAFLSRLIAASPSLEMQTHISRILWQELGEGDMNKAHKQIYITTMTAAGFARESVAEAQPFDETTELVAGYQRASESYLSGLGFMYGTEVADLAMVSTIGDLVRETTGRRDLPWVDIHIRQEPDHLDSSNKALRPALTVEQQRQVIESARQMWALWIAFFKRIKEAIM
jgi:pyrroloquinoline quinone (PQQ) biosynthesis protein C